MYMPLRYTHQGVLWKPAEHPDSYSNAEKGWNADTPRKRALLDGFSR